MSRMFDRRGLGLDGALGAHRARSRVVFHCDWEQKRYGERDRRSWSSRGSNESPREVSLLRAIEHIAERLAPSLTCVPALCCRVTRMSIGPASIAPFLAGLWTAPSPTRVVLRSGPCRARRCGPATPGWRVSSRDAVTAAGADAASDLSSCAAMDCVVTGGAGFIGSNLVDALVARGDRVTVIDNLSTGKRANLERRSRAARRCASDRRPRRAGGAGGVRAGAAGARLSPRRPDRRPLLGRGPAPATPTSTCSGRSPCSRPRAASGAQAVRQQLHRRRPVRRRRACCRRPRTTRSDRWLRTGRASTPPRATAGCTRACTASRRSRCATATSTAPAGRPRRGRRGRDLLRTPRRGPHADRVRRRPPDARLGRGRRRRAGEPARRGRRRSPARSTSARAGRPRCSNCSRRCATWATGAPLAEPEFAPERPGRGPAQLPGCGACRTRAGMGGRGGAARGAAEDLADETSGASAF